MGDRRGNPPSGARSPLACVTSRRRPGGQKHYGFEPKVWRPRDHNRKGKVERPSGTVFRDGDRYGVGEVERVSSGPEHPSLARTPGP